ncbi:hypothetical protein [Marinobacter sp.]|uniref:hypothetical protein n=1 Tax=Marinobacter sp. TaxID=50741 RepID=UPI002621BF7E|nr:hypothetical protein [Marinobacter sp.]
MKVNCNFEHTAHVHADACASMLELLMQQNPYIFECGVDFYYKTRRKLNPSDPLPSEQWNFIRQTRPVTTAIPTGDGGKEIVLGARSDERKDFTETFWLGFDGNLYFSNLKNDHFSTVVLAWLVLIDQEIPFRASFDGLRDDVRNAALKLAKSILPSLRLPEWLPASGAEATIFRPEFLDFRK